MPTLTVSGETLSIVMDALGRVCALAMGGEDYVFAAGSTQEVTDAEPMVVPLADDFAEAGMPAVTLALGPWKPVLQPGQERLQLVVLGTIWVPRVPLGENTLRLYAARDNLVDAFIAHALAFEHEATMQSAVLMGGPGIRPRALPRRNAAEDTGLYLTLPFTVDVRLMRSVVPRPE